MYKTYAVVGLVFACGFAMGQQKTGTQRAPTSSAKTPSSGAPSELAPKNTDEGFIPGRRADQKRTSTGYIFTPAAAQIPGIGFTYGLLGSVFNVGETETDVLGFRFWGDLSGIGMAVLEFPLGWEPLSLNVFFNDFEKVSIESHRRGIHSNPEDKKLIEIDSFGVTLAQLNLRFWRRRIQVNAGANQQQSELAAIRDSDGNIIAEGDGSEQKSFNRSLGVILDLSDDRYDPRDGFQMEVYRYDKPDPGGDQPHFYTMDYNFSYFIPVLAYSTWAFNLFKSSAIVQREGETDKGKIRSQIGIKCPTDGSTTASSCESTREDFVSETHSSNKYGTATPLGGSQRLRSYVTNRFFAGHSLFYGTELRWNLTQEFSPFDWLVAAGVRTGLQVAAFAEGGTVNDFESKLAEDHVYSYGGGVRMILASGFIVRFDLANGSEGTQPSLIFQYPWSVF